MLSAPRATEYASSSKNRSIALFRQLLHRYYPLRRSDRLRCFKDSHESHDTRLMTSFTPLLPRYPIHRAQPIPHKQTPPAMAAHTSARPHSHHQLQTPCSSQSNDHQSPSPNPSQQASHSRQPLCTKSKQLRSQPQTKRPMNTPLSSPAQQKQTSHSRNPSLSPLLLSASARSLPKRLT